MEWSDQLLEQVEDSFNVTVDPVVVQQQQQQDEQTRKRDCCNRRQQQQQTQQIVCISSSTHQNNTINNNSNDINNIDIDEERLFMESLLNPNFDELSRQFTYFHKEYQSIVHKMNSNNNNNNSNNVKTTNNSSNNNTMNNNNNNNNKKSNKPFSYYITPEFSIALSRAILQIYFHISLQLHNEEDVNGKDASNTSSSSSLTTSSTTTTTSSYRFLCPPIPNRFYYVQWIITTLLPLLSNPYYYYDDETKFDCDTQNQNNNNIYYGLDIGTGATCIYPILMSHYNRKVTSSSTTTSTTRNTTPSKTTTTNINNNNNNSNNNNNNLIIMYATDIDPDAIELAKLNVRNNQLQSYIHVQLVPKSSSQQQQLTTIKSNNPFISNPNNNTNNTNTTNDLVKDDISMGPLLQSLHAIYQSSSPSLQESIGNYNDTSNNKHSITQQQQQQQQIYFVMVNPPFYDTIHTTTSTSSSSTTSTTNMNTNMNSASIGIGMDVDDNHNTYDLDIINQTSDKDNNNNNNQSKRKQQRQQNLIRRGTCMTVNEGYYPNGEVGFGLDMIIDSWKLYLQQQQQQHQHHGIDESKPTNQRFILLPHWISMMCGKKSTFLYIQHILHQLLGPAHVCCTEFGPGEHTRWFIAWTYHRPTIRSPLAKVDVANNNFTVVVDGQLPLLAKCPAETSVFTPVVDQSSSLWKSICEVVANRFVDYSRTFPILSDEGNVIVCEESMIVNDNQRRIYRKPQLLPIMKLQIYEKECNNVVSPTLQKIQWVGDETLPDSLQRLCSVEHCHPNVRKRLLPIQFGHYLVDITLSVQSTKSNNDPNNGNNHLVHVHVDYYRHSTYGQKVIDKMKQQMEGEICRTNRRWRRSLQQQQQDNKIDKNRDDVSQAMDVSI